jgi:hypothetical protein
VVRTLTVSLVLAAALAAGWFATRPRGTDEEQIRRLLEQARSAAASKNLGLALSVLSEEYRGEGGSKNEVRLLLLQALRDIPGIRADFELTSLSISGDSAAAEALVRVRLRSQDGTATDLETSATLRFQREDHRRLLIYPVREWRLVEANVRRGAADLL